MKNRTRYLALFSIAAIVLLALGDLGCTKSSEQQLAGGTPGVDEQTTSATEGTTLSIADTELAPATYKTAYSETLEGTGGSGEYTFMAAGLPDGLVLSGNVISGLAEEVGTFTVAIKMTDSQSGETAEKWLDLLVNKETPKIVISKILVDFWTVIDAEEISVQKNVNLRAQVQGGAPGYTWSTVGLPESEMDNPICLSSEAFDSTCAHKLSATDQPLTIYIRVKSSSAPVPITFQIKAESPYSNPVEKSITFTGIEM